MRIAPIFQYYQNEMTGNLYKVGKAYYYKIYYKINGKDKLISLSYVNLYDKSLCLERMFHDMNLIDEGKVKRLK